MISDLISPAYLRMSGFYVIGVYYGSAVGAMANGIYSQCQRGHLR